MKTGQSFGEWLPQNRRMVADWVNDLIDNIKEESEPGMNLKNAAVKTVSPEMGHKKMVTFKHQEVLEFKQKVMEDPTLRLLAEQMIAQGYAYKTEDPTGKPQIQDLDTLFKLIDVIIETAPEYMQPEEDGRGLIGFPINAVLDWCMGTQAGYAFF